MTKILIGECKQEVSTFNPVPSTIEDFEISVGEEICTYHQDVRAEDGGCIEYLDQSGGCRRSFLPIAHEPLPLVVSLEQASFAQIADTFLSAVQNAPPVDGVYISMHGAMSGRGGG